KSQKKVYDACFLGGLRHSKGIDELVPIWGRVTEKFPQAKIIIIGGGTSEITDKLRNDIKSHNLEDNILLLGPLSRVALFKKIKSCRLFLFPSHEEGWGIALCEAMYCGLPIICYDLPAFKTFGEVVDKYEVGKYNDLSNKVLDYLKHPQKIANKKHSLVNVAKSYSWDKIAREEIQVYNKFLYVTANK
ncbi:glycosyltransferase family 4 protein, partial [Patescibacteria group bacterium]